MRGLGRGERERFPPSFFPTSLAPALPFPNYAGHAGYSIAITCALLLTYCDRCLLFCISNECSCTVPSEITKSFLV